MEVFNYNLRLIIEQGHIMKILQKYLPETWQTMGVAKAEKGGVLNAQ